MFITNTESDEVMHDCYTRDRDVQEFVKKNNIQGNKGVYKYFVDRTSKIAMKYGKNPIVWNEVYDTIGTQLNKDIIVQLWQGGCRKKRQQMINERYKVIVSYGWYLDHVMNQWQDMYLEDPRADLNGNNVDNVIGGETCMWSEKIDLSNLLSTVAERLWSHKDVRDVKTAGNRYRYFRCLLIRRGIGASPANIKESRQAPPMQDSCFNQ